MHPLMNVAFLLVIGVQISYGYLTINAGRPPMCPTPNKPCRIRFTVGDIGGGEIENNGADTCTCSPPYECSHDWDDRLKVVSRKIVSTSLNITLQMRFCQVVAPIRFCRRRDIAIELQGSQLLPQDILAYNCRCRRRKPLVLVSRRIGEDYMTYHAYKCANHMRTCSESSPCLTMDEDDYSTQYLCQCPQGLQCRTDGPTGYCAP